MVALTQDKTVLGGHGRERSVEFGIDEQHLGTGVLNDVANLWLGEAKVDRH